MGDPTDPNATGTPRPLPADRFGGSGRESQERNAALARGEARPAAQQHLDREAFVRMGAHRLFTTLADNVRDYAVFLLDASGIIRYWGEGARLMKWWTREQTEGAHLRLLYLDGIRRRHGGEPPANGIERRRVHRRGPTGPQRRIYVLGWGDAHCVEG
jgi:PAS domain-containing protein